MATEVNPRALINKLNPVCRTTFESALGLCVARTNYNVEVEHWLLKLLEADGTDLARVFKHYDLDIGRLKQSLTRALDKLKNGNARAPALSLEILDWIREAWVLASLEYNTTQVRSGHLLVALIADRGLASRVQSVSPEFARLNADQLRKELPTLQSGTAEDSAVPPAAADGAPGQPAAGSKTPALDQFTINLTERAQKKELDPVIGRDAEIRQVVDILMRRRQNNPILTGEAGVGKTAVVEGFALKVAAGDVPPPLKGVAVRTLDLGLLQAGAGVKGEFENRLKAVIAEVKASAQPIILFIDEAHTLIGAGGSAGMGDAANLLKPALARGELRTIAATTWMEYKKYFETDAALKRRFQVVKVDEPDEERASAMLRGLTGWLEKHHKVRILSDAVSDAVKLSRRYMPDRQLPDKAVSLLDTACARIALGLSATPATIEDCQRHIEQLTLNLQILEREQAVGVDHSRTHRELTEQRQTEEQRLQDLRKRWDEEKRLVSIIQELSTKLAASAGKDAKVKLSPEEEKRSREELDLRQKELEKLQGENPLLKPFVDSQTVANVVSAWTGIPVGKMVRDEIKTFLTLKERLEERVVGQSHALEAIAQRISTARAGLGDPRRPIGVFLLAGPSGVGKTETAMALADILYGGERNMVILNMSEYKEQMHVTRLTGSAPGLVGYGEGSVLTEGVRRKPYSVILLDEVEKAHPGCHDIFYQVFDKGQLRDDKGNEVDFKNTIILLTSNAGSETIHKACADPDTIPNAQGLGEMLRPDLLKVFKPALLGRMTVVPYFPLADAVLRQIIQLQLKKIIERARLNHQAELTYDDSLISTIASRCKEVESGARNVDHILTGTLLPQLSREFLSNMAEGRIITRAHVGVTPEGNFQYRID